MKKHILRGAILLFVLAPCAFAAHGPEGGITTRMAHLVLQLGVILFAARLGNLLFERLKLAGVLGEVVAGILIGPSLLGSLPVAGLPDGVFPHVGTFPVSAELYGLCAVAAVLLLFLVGLETELRLLLRYSRAAIIVGVGGVAVSFVFGDLISMAFSPLIFGESLGFFAPQCLFLGLISTATSVGISARILTEKRKLDSPEGATILAGAVLDDVIGVILLAVVMGIITASKTTGSIDWGHIGAIAGKAIGVWLVALVVGLVASRRISFLLKSFRDRSTIALMALGLALILASIFEGMGLAMIVGAYVMGISLSRTDIRDVIRERLMPIYGFLVPVFFCVLGMFVDFRVLTAWPVILFGLTYALVAMAAKVIGCGLPVLACGFNFLGAMRVGFGMLPRCEIALTITGIGMAAGVIPPQVVGVAVLLMISTTVIAPPVLLRLFSIDTPGTREPVPTGEQQEETFSVPSLELADLIRPRILDVFDSEGFFVHTIDHEHHVSVLRKDGMAIEFRQNGRHLVFSCGAEDVPLVNTAVYEVLSTLERTLAALRHPFDDQDMTRRLVSASPGGGNILDLSHYLDPARLQPELNGSTKEEIIEELFRLFDGSGALIDPAAARKAVREREETMSTGLENGIAIPHGRTDAVKQLVCAIGLKKDGADFNALDGEPSTIFILMLSPVTKPAPHVQFMSTVSQILTDEGRAWLLGCATPEQMLTTIGNLCAAKKK